MPRETQLTILIGVIVTIIGYFIPEYYDWSGADQSRAAPIVSVHGVLLAVMNVVALAGIYFWFRRSRFEGDGSSLSGPRLQISIRQIVILTAIVACLTAVVMGASSLRDEHQRFAAVFLSASAGFAVLLTVIVAIIKPAWRLQIFAMLACQFGPFLWVVRMIAGARTVGSDFIFLVPVMPALIPAHIVSNMALRTQAAQGAIAAVAATGQLAVGLWLIQNGRKRALAYSIVLASCSIAGSFVLNALMRM